MRSALLCFALSLPSLAQSSDPQAILDRVRQQVSALVDAAPRYTCTEIVERSWYHNPRPDPPGCDTDRAPKIGRRTLIETDRLRFDMAVGADQEIFSWHGDERFKTENIDSLVTAGPIHSGSYFGFLSSIFLEGSSQIDYIGSRDEDGHQVAVFRYTVSKIQSTFVTETNVGQTGMGYHGEFTADPVTYKVQQLTVISDGKEVPESARFCSVRLDTRYEDALLNGTAFRLPGKVDMTLLDRNREVKHTSTRYEACHEFTAESQIRFDAAPEVSTVAAAPNAFKDLPSGLKVAIRITSDTAAAKSWGGDPVTGELVNDLVDASGAILEPSGAVAKGHLLDMETILRPEPFFIATVEFSQLGRYNLRLQSVTGQHLSASYQMPRRLRLDSRRLSENPNVCRYRLKDKQASLKGAVTHWITR